MHPMLLPGSHLVRRGGDQLQAGLDPTAAVVLPPGTAPRITTLGDQDPAVTTLLRAGLAVRDDHPFRAALPAHSPDTTWARHTLSALAREAGDLLPERLAGRARHRVDVVTFGHPLAEPIGRDLRTVCDRAGLRGAEPAHPGPLRKGEVRPQVVAVLVGVGEPRRELLDGWVRDGIPHLVVRLVEGWATVGPFVVPGRTACLRCIDAYRTEEDPAWPLLVEQYSHATASDRVDGVPEPVDAALAAIAVGWAARDVATYVEGGHPASLSSTVRLAPLLTGIERSQWPPHPHCGCGWG